MIINNGITLIYPKHKNIEGLYGKHTKHYSNVPLDDFASVEISMMSKAPYQEDDLLLSVKSWDKPTKDGLVIGMDISFRTSECGDSSSEILFGNMDHCKYGKNKCESCPNNLGKFINNRLKQYE